MRIKEKIRKIKNRLIDSKFLFTHSHLMRNMVESIEDELISQYTSILHGTILEISSKSLELIM